MTDAVIEQLLAAEEREKSRDHQVVGVKKLVERPYFALFDEVGAGKSKQVVDAAQILYRVGVIDTVLVITPGFARSTWAEEDPILGEVAKHAWDATPNVIHEYHKHYFALALEANALNWVVTNFEFVRRKEREHDLLKQLRGRKVWLVIDESWAVKGNSDQTKACLRIRYKRCDRATILNGTPLADGKPLDLFYQMQMLDRDILGVTSMTHFKAKYCITGKADPKRPWEAKRIVGYQNLDEFNARIAPHVLSRRTRDCWDLPEMLPPVLVEAPMSHGTWKIYKEMRDEMVTWIGTQASISRQAIVRILRLAQITSGFLGGLESIDLDPDLSLGAGVSTSSASSLLGPAPQWLRSIHEQAPSIQSQSTANPSPAHAGSVLAVPPVVAPPAGPVTREIGREKLDALMHWLGTFEAQPKKLLVWCRFTPEQLRTADELKRLYPRVEMLIGGQSAEERRSAKALLAPNGDPDPGAVVGKQSAGGASVNFSAANIAIYLSQGPRLLERTQSIGRIERPGQQNKMTIVDIVATGPKKQKTIDHHILKALREKKDMADWTVGEWRRILSEE